MAAVIHDTLLRNITEEDYFNRSNNQYAYRGLKTVQKFSEGAKRSLQRMAKHKWRSARLPLYGRFTRMLI
jgi:hypothetical protein